MWPREGVATLRLFINGDFGFLGLEKPSHVCFA